MLEGDIMDVYAEIVNVDQQMNKVVVNFNKLIGGLVEAKVEFGIPNVDLLLGFGIGFRMKDEFVAD